MEEVAIANAQLKAARDNIEREYKAQIDKLDSKESELLERFNALDKRKLETAEANGNVDTAGDDVVEINAGGKVIAAKRSTLTQLKGARMEALFSGRWDNKLQRDNNGRIFLDVNPKVFRAIVDYLNELVISSEDDPPDRPSVDDEHEHILKHQLELFGLFQREMPDSNIINDRSHASLLHDWLKEDGSDGEFHLLHRSSRDGLANRTFHSECDNKGCTLTIIETTDGYIVGGYSNTPWTSSTTTGRYFEADKAFLFILSGSDVSSPYKMKLKNANDDKAIRHKASFGPTFGAGHDLRVNGSSVYLRFGHSYESSPSGLLTTLTNGSHAVFAIKEMEVFEVTELSRAKQEAQREVPLVDPVGIFSESLNEAINTKQVTLLQAESELVHLEEFFRDEAEFVTAFAIGDTKDIVSLNVSGTMMITKRSTLCTAEDSALAQQFDDTKWTEQGRKSLRVKEWTSNEVSAWVGRIDGIPNEVANTFEENEITGRELLSLKKDGLMMLGITRTGTLCLLLEEIDMLEKASQDVVTLIEHSPYCFGKIVDYLRLKQLHSQGLVEEPALPTVCDSQKSRFEKVVKYFFPGDSAKYILG